METIISNIITSSLPLITQPFNAIEIHPCKLIDEHNVQQCEPQEAQIWSLYIHLCQGGLECIADFASEDLANNFRNFLNSFKTLYTSESEGLITWYVDDFDSRARGHEMDQIEELDPELYQQLESDSEMEIPSQYIIYDRSKFKEALARMIDKHDSTEGIHWITVDCYLDDMCKLIKS
ncbi:MAG: hypothetical protein WAU36_04185 [Cyclobacteriaceae bacterium]